MKKIIILIVSLLILVSCAEKQENVGNRTVSKKIENQKKIEEKMEVKNEEKENNLEEVKKLKERKKKIAEIKRKIKEKNLKKKEELEKSNKNIAKDNDVVEFCRNLISKKIIGVCSFNIGKENIPKSDDDTTFLIKKIGNGEIIREGDFLEIKNSKLPFVAGKIKKHSFKDGIYAIGINGVGLPLGTEGIFQKQKIILNKKISEKKFLSSYTKFGIKEEKIKDDIKDRYEKQKYSIGIGNGIYFDEIILGKGFNYGDEICLKDEEGLFKKIEINNIGGLSTIIVDGKLGIGTKFKQYYNGGNGGEIKEIIDLKYCYSFNNG